MSRSNAAAVAAFIEGVPPGELADVVADLKALNIDRNLLESSNPAFETYNETQLTAATLPGNSQSVLISSYNRLGDGRYYDVESKSSFVLDHITQKVSAVQSHNLESKHEDLIKSLLKALANHTQEHYPSASYAVFPTPENSLAILLAATKYSPSNFWNGSWRSTYLFTPGSASLTGTIHVDVHYYEDGNVRLTTAKPVTLSISSAAAATDVVRQIALAEKRYQDDLNRGFAALSEGVFKGLRRQLPVTRQKVEWEKIGSYRLGQDIGGAKR